MRTLKLGLLGFLALILSGCDQDFMNQLTSSSPAGVPGVTSNKVAVLLPLSGALQPVGQEMRNAIALAQQDTGTGLEVQFFDTQGSSAGAAAAAAQAKSFGAGIVLGPLLGANIDSVRSGLGNGPAIVAFSNDVTKAGNNNFVFGLTPANSAKRILQYAARQGKTQIAILYPQNDFGRAATAAAVAVAPSLGINIVMSEGYSSSAGRDGASSRQAAAQKVGARRGSINGLFIPDGGGRLREVASLAFFYEVDPRQDTYLGTQLMDDASLTTEPALNGAKYSAVQGTISQFESRFAAAYGSSPRSISAVAYDAMALAATIKASGQSFGVGSLTRTDGYKGVMGTYRIYATGTTERLMSVNEITSSGLRVVQAAGSSFVF